MFNSLDVVKYIVAQYPEVLKDKHLFGDTGFISACRYNRIETVKFLVTYDPSLLK